MFSTQCTPLWNIKLTRHEHLVLVVLVRVREDVGTLDGLWEEAKNVINDQQCGFSILGSSGVGLHAVDGDPFALLFVALAHDWRDGAASLGLCRHGCESPRAVCLGWMFETCSENGVDGGGSGRKGLGDLRSEDGES